MQTRQQGQLIFNSPIGKLSIKNRSDKSLRYCVEMPVPQLVACPPISLAVIDALNCSGKSDVLNANIVSNDSGSKRLLLLMKDGEALAAIKPNFAKLKNSLQELAVLGVFTYSMKNLTSSEVMGRMFTPEIGINEDPVNGNSSVALAAVIHAQCQQRDIECPKLLTVHQGFSLNRSGIVTIHLKHDDGLLTQVAMEGSVCEVYSFKLSLP